MTFQRMRGVGDRRQVRMLAAGLAATALLVGAVAPAPVVSLPLTAEPIHDVAGLTRLATLLSEQRDAGQSPEHW